MSKSGSFVKQENFALVAIVCFIFLIIGGLFLLREQRRGEIQSTKMVEPIPMYSETYIGTLPCADCPGLQTELTFERASPSAQQGTFLLKETYLERNNNQPNLTEGTWTLSKGNQQNPKALIYILTSSQQQSPSYYQQVDAQHLKQLDGDMQSIPAPMNFTLTKQE